jgi:glutamine amidotransferase PdxT
MTIEDMKILERNHEQAVRQLQNLATNIVDFLMAGGEFTTMQQLAYREAQKKVLRIKRDLAKALEDEFEGVLHG